MAKKINEILETLGLEKTGKWENHFYVIRFADSNEYSDIYSILQNSPAINTEYPYFESNSSKNTVKIINYFELDFENTIYPIFLFADFETNQYYLKIKFEE